MACPAWGGAHRTEQAQRLGVWLDPLCDKLFMGGVLLAIFQLANPPAYWLGLLVCREIFQFLPSVVFVLFPAVRSRIRFRCDSNKFGRLVTIIQYCASLLWLFGRSSEAKAFTVAAAGTGLVSALVYASRIRIRIRKASL